MKYVGLLLVVVGVFFGLRFLSTISHTVSYIQPYIHTEVKTPDKPLTFLAVGDIMLGRYVETLMKVNNDQYPFEKIEETLHSVDSVIANLEGPIREPHTQTPSKTFKFSFSKNIPALLADNNISIVSLANNHTYDFGKEGYEQTAQFLRESGIEFAGHPVTLGEQYVLRKTINNKKFIFVGFNTTYTFNYEAAQNFITNLEKEGAFLIAMIHGGEEYELTSNAEQQIFYRGLIDNGVDLVLGHHPHVVQEVEVYKDKAIFYSLGNFIFDQYFSKDVQELLGVKMTFTEDMVTYDLIPMKSVVSQPMLMTAEEADSLLSKLAARSPNAVQAAIKAGKLELAYQAQ